MNSHAETFVFSSYLFDRSKQTATFIYEVILSGGEKKTFTERILFPHPFPKDLSVPDELLDLSLANLHLMLGVSYWKLYCPHNIQIKTHALTQKQADFWNTVYTKGLGEFFYHNKLEFKNFIRFPFVEAAHPPAAIEAPIPSQALVGVGGGKDSIVVIEDGKHKKLTFSGFIVETDKHNTIAREIAATAGIKTVIVERHIGPQVFELNKSSDVYNGHVPVSAVYAFLGLLTGLLYGYDSFIVGNEKSADEPNVTYQGEPINHQWSKSSEFETLFSEYGKAWITPSFRYFSPLRDKTELEIIKDFVHYKQYFPIFSSCNRNFAITQKANTRWCGSCPKCAFVFLAMATVLSKKEVVGVFGKNLFEDMSLLPLYRQLLGKEEAKPFECVGTFEEVREAFGLVSQNLEYSSDTVITAIGTYH